MKRFALIEAELSALPVIEPLLIPEAESCNVKLACLRLDQIHPFVSGNKWYKLQHHLLAAEAHEKQSLLSFGGAYSNHLHALAYAGQMLQIPTIGVIRGEPPRQLSPTLEDCQKWGMVLHWVSRDQYRSQSQVHQGGEWQARYPEAWIIPEGG